MTNFTRRAIKYAFLKLLEEKALSRITVRDIAEECGISRNTFYYHFEDVPSLLLSVFMEATDEIIEEHAGTDTLEECIELVAEFAIKNKKIVMNIYRSSSREVYEMHLTRVIDHAIESYTKKIRSGAYEDIELTEEDEAIVLRILRAEAFGLVIDWLNHNMNYDLVDNFKRYRDLRMGVFGKAVDAIVYQQR